MCRLSMDGYLAVVLTNLPPALVSNRALTRIRTVAAKLPPCSLAGLELRLREDRPEVDFFVRLPHGTPAFQADLLAHPIWQAIERVTREVSAPSGALQTQVRFLFLEFDLDVPVPEIPVPALFFELHTNRRFTGAELAALASVVLGTAGNRACPDSFDGCITALPQGANIAHIGVMPSRPGSATRIVIDGMSAAAVGTYLRAVGWRDSTAGFAPLLEEIAAISDPVVMVNLDVDDGVRSKVGVEFYMRGTTDNASRWGALFDVLARRKLASVAKTRALIAWPGFTEETAANPVWANNLSFGDLLFRGLARSMFWRTINHVKLTYDPGREPEVKAYLGLGHNWFPTSDTSSEDELIAR